ncbi:ATP-binding protein [candidate division KSB1 bacterium]|nr:ATP-binding protein [candidate division KSB1 bacterium]
MFVNRKNELNELEQSWKDKKSNFLIVYGSRRVGKTGLIKQFLQNKFGFYFLADRLPERENLKTLTRIVKSTYEDEFLGNFEDWYTFFNYLKSNVKRKIVIIIDEFPYLLETNPALSSIFQKGWDEYLKDLSVFFILCGSSIGMMEREALTYKAPLYGRRTGQLFIKPLSFYNFTEFFPKVSFERKLELFTISGGIPAYIQQFNSKLSVKENLTKFILQPGSYLYQEVDFILKEEVRTPRVYFSILKAIALGKRKFGDIVNETGLEKTSLHKYLYILEELQLIQKEFPVTEKNIAKSRKGLYKLTDNFFRCWFNFVFPFHSELEFGNIEPSIYRFEQYFTHLAALIYEEISVDIIRLYQNKLFQFSRVGRWWHKENEIDIVAYDFLKKNILFAEVKWSKNLVGTNIYYSLREKSELVNWEWEKSHFALVSRSGFTKDMISLAEKENVLLIKGDEIV